MKPIIFRGHHHTGKTTLMERAVAALRQRGYTVAAVKHSPGLRVKEEPHDSSRLLRAGSREVALLAADAEVLYRPFAGSPLARLQALVGELDCDFMLIEGFKNYRGPTPNIVFGESIAQVRRLLNEHTVACSGTFTAGTAPGGPELPPGVPCLPLTISGEELADFIERIAREFPASGPPA